MSGTIASTCLLLAVGLPSGQLGHPTDVTPGRSKGLVVGLDAAALAAAVFSDSIGLPQAPSFQYPGVVRKYQRHAANQAFEILIGIYANEEQAGRALWRTSPQVMGAAAEPLGDDCFFSNRACHMRMGNAVVMVILDRKLRQEEALTIARAIDGALRDPAVVTFGDTVNVPGIEILAADTTKSPTPVVFEVGPEDSLVFPRAGRGLDRGRREVRVRREIYDDEPTLRVARVTGEVLEVPLSEMSALPKALPANEPAATKQLSDAECEELIGKLRAKEEDLVSQAAWALSLSLQEDEGIVPLLIEILDSNQHPTVKKHALRGLAKRRAAGGLDGYCSYAADRSQPDLIRRDAIRLIGRFGDRSDVPLLETILEEDIEVLFQALTEAIERLQDK